MTDVTLIEIQDQAVGLVTRDGRMFRFHAAAHAFHPLEGQTFESALAAERAARRLIASAKRRNGIVMPVRHGEASTAHPRRRPPALSSRTRRAMRRTQAALGD